jgi:hypothetical protein
VVAADEPSAHAVLLQVEPPDAAASGGETSFRNQSSDVFAMDITPNCRDIENRRPFGENELSGPLWRVCISGVAVLGWKCFLCPFPEENLPCP